MRAPISRIAPCRSKLKRTRRSKSGSGGTLSPGKDASMAKNGKKLFPDSTLRLRKRQLSDEASSVPIRSRPQPLPALPFQRIDLREDDGDVLLLLIEHGAPLGKDLQEFDQLRPLPPG